MEITKKNAFIEFMKKSWVYFIVGVVVFAIALTFTLAASLHETVPTSIESISFSNPMQNAVVVKDFSNTELQENKTLKQWEAHLGIDLTSDSKDVLSIANGEVVDVSYDYLNGNVVTIKHSDGFVSKYSSLANENLVKVGTKVSGGEKIGEISQSGAAELEYGDHLHLTMFLNDNCVNPNDYLDLQLK
jgi:murein DD-endopeptidase MepM/ murein hydrolase activator NlpD